MNKTIIQNTLLKVFKQSFPNNSNEITLEDKPQDIDAWDSLGHMMLISNIEQEFNINFDFDEMLDLDSVISIVNVLFEKLNSKN